MSSLPVQRRSQLSSPCWSLSPGSSRLPAPGAVTERQQGDVSPAELTAHSWEQEYQNALCSCGSQLEVDLPLVGKSGVTEAVSKAVDRSTGVKLVGTSWGSPHAHVEE